MLCFAINTNMTLDIGIMHTLYYIWGIWGGDTGDFIYKPTHFIF